MRNGEIEMLNHQLKKISVEDIRMLQDKFNLSEVLIKNVIEGVIEIEKNGEFFLVEGFVGLLLSGALYSYTLSTDIVSDKKIKNVSCLFCNELYGDLCPVIPSNKYIRFVIENKPINHESRPVIKSVIKSKILILDILKITQYDYIQNIIHAYYRRFPELSEKLIEVIGINNIREKKRKIYELFPDVFRYYSDKTISNYFKINYSSWKNTHI